MSYYAAYIALFYLGSRSTASLETRKFNSDLAARRYEMQSPRRRANNKRSSLSKASSLFPSDFNFFSNQESVATGPRMSPTLSSERVTCSTFSLPTLTVIISLSEISPIRQRLVFVECTTPACIQFVPINSRPRLPKSSSLTHPFPPYESRLWVHTRLPTQKTSSESADKSLTLARLQSQDGDDRQLQYFYSSRYPTSSHEQIRSVP